jgi:phosphoenolpyruvate synthase/pyruvate phosphate dikinase
VAKNNLVQKAIVNVVRNLIDFQETASPGQGRIVRDSRGGLSQRGVHKKKSSGQKVFVKFMGEKTLVVLWVDAENEAHGRQSFTANKEVDRRIASQVDNLQKELEKYVVVGSNFSVDETANLSELLTLSQSGNGVGPFGTKANSLLYLRSGRVGRGIGGAGVEAMLLLLGASVLGGVGMGFFVLPLFSLAHVWVIARQNHGMSVAQRVRQFLWHWFMAMPYALIGLSGVQEILGGENAAQLFAVAWHLGTDIVFMAQDQISARKAARDTMDMLLPPAGPLLIEQVGGARWGLGLSLFWILLAYPDLSSSELVAGLVVGALTSNGSSSHIKFIGDDEPLDPAHDGEKAYHLGVLARLGVNVPPGFALQPSFYINDYQRTKSLSNVMADVLVALKRLEEKTGQVFGNEQNPLFLSVRSNAGEEESMPGLMKTIINVGLNQATLRGLVERDGEWFAQDTLRRFIRSYATAVYDISDEEFYLASTELLLKYKVGEERLLPAEGLARLVDNYRSIVREHGREIPEDVNEQLKESLEAVLKSFDTGGAQIFKEVRGLSNAGMGAIVQKVVFGNLDDRSGAGVVFTRNRRTGENSLDGQFGNRIQGEDLVSGFQSTGMKDALLLKAEMPHVYDSLLHIKSLVENKFGWPQDIEFTIQKGELFILQTRRAALSPEAFLQAGEDMVNEGIIPTNVFITRQAVEMGKLKELFHLRPGINAEVIMRGTTGTPGAQRGRMMFSDRFDPFHPPEDPVIVVDPNPDAQNLLRILFSPHVSGLITFEGPRTSHARTRCQSSDMASVMGIEGISRDGNDILLSNGVRIQEGVWIVVDGDRRRVLLTEETDVLERSKLIRDASLRMDEVQGIEEQVQRQWRGALYEEVLEEYVVAAQDLERIKEKFPTISRSELDTANVRLHTLHLIAWEKGAEQGISRERVNRDFVAMKQMILKSIVAEEALRKGEVSIMLLEDSSTDRSGSKCLDPMHAELLFGDTLAKNRERAERIRQEKYPEYPSKERLLRAETRHHDGGGVRFFTHLIYVNVPSGRVGAETKQDLVVAQNLKYQEIIGNLGAGSPTIRYDEAQRQPINMYQADTIQLHWRPNTDSNNTSRLSLVINSPTNGDLTLSETGTSTTIVFSNETVAEIPYQCLRSLFKVNDSVYLVVSPELSRLLDNHGIPRVFTKGRGRDLTSVRIVSSTVAPAIKKNIQGRAVQDYIEKDLSALQEFKKDYWDPLVSTLTGDQLHALIKLIFYYEVRTCFQKMPPFLLLNHDVFRQMVPEMSQDRWEDQLYLDGIIRQLLQAIKLDNTEIDSLLVQFNDSSVIPPALDNVSYSSFLQMFRAFARAGAILPNKLRDMLNFLERRKYSSPWDENGLFRVAAGLLPEEKKPDPPSTEPDDPPPPPQNPDLGPGDVAKTDAIVVANLLREATKDNNKPLLLEALLPTNQPLQALLGNTRGGAAQQETVFDRIKKFQTDPAYTVPFKEALKSALGDTGILAGTDLGHQQAGVISLNRDNHSSVQAEIQLRGTLNTLFEGLGLRDQAQPLYRTIVIPTSDEAVKLVDQLGAKTFPGTYVAIPQFGPGETLTVPKLVKACEELIAKGWIVPATVLVPLNKMENLDSASLTNTYLTPLENKLKTLAVTAKDLPELKRVTQEIKSFLDLLKTVAEMA